MRLFISEFITGGGLVHDPLPHSLKQEGLMMLHALVRDCRKISDLEITITLDKRIEFQADWVHIVRLNEEHDYMRVVEKNARQHDITWVIAPESDDTLVSLVEMLERHNVSLINCDSNSIELCSDKLRCDQFLTSRGIQVVPSLTSAQMQNFDQAVIVKPRKGVGCVGMIKFAFGSDALKYMQNILLHPADYYAQPFITGQHKSLSLLCLDGRAIILSCNTQTINFDHPIMLTSCVTNAVTVTIQMKQLAEKIAMELPGLRGYVGVDFIETTEHLYVVDINPRLTSSYVGLSQCLFNNPAQLCIKMHTNNILPDVIERLPTKAEVDIA